MSNHRINKRPHLIKRRLCIVPVVPLIAALIVACDGGTPTQAVSYPDTDTPAARLFIEKCGHCHAAPQPSAHVAKRWPGVMQRMQFRMTSKSITPLNPQQFATILEYLQAHAKDQ